MMNKETKTTYEHFKYHSGLCGLAKSNETIENIALAIQTIIDQQLEIARITLIKDLSMLLVNVARMKIDVMQIAQQLKKDAGTYSTANYDDVHF